MHMKRILISCCLLCLLMAGATVSAQTASYTVAPAVTELYGRLTALPAVQKGLDFLKADHANTVAEQKQICEIPSPPFKEQVRAADFQKRLAALGLKDVQMDKEGNVCGLRPGTGNGPKLLVAALNCI
jgi:tripeptide aminopeptidase